MSWLVNNIGSYALNLFDTREQARLDQIKDVSLKIEIGCKVAIVALSSFAYFSASFIFPINYCFGASLILASVSSALLSYDFMLMSQKIGQSPKILPSFEKFQEFMKEIEGGLQSSTRGNSTIFNDITGTIEKIDGEVSSLVKDTSFLTKAIFNDLREFVTAWLLIGASFKVAPNLLQKTIYLGDAPHLKHLQNGLSRVMHAVESVFLQISAFFALSSAILVLITYYSMFPLLIFSTSMICALIACICRDVSLVTCNINKEIVNHEGLDAVASMSDGYGIMGTFKTAYYALANFTTPASFNTLTTLVQSQDATQLKNNMTPFLESCSYDLFEKLIKETSPLINNPIIRQYFKDFVEAAKK